VFTGRGEQVALRDEDGREEDDEQDLRELTWLNAESGQANPDLRAVHARELRRQDRRNRQEHQTCEAERVAEPRHQAVVLQEHEQQHETGDRQCSPHDLLVRIR
jgi:hypothetical protein